MPKYRGTRPKGLPKLPIAWRPWSLADRIGAVKRLGDYTLAEQQAAVAISMNEQPNRVLNGNSVGFMCWAAKYPYGWTSKVLESVQITGYTECPEGQSDRIGFFLAFAKPEDSLLVLIRIVHSRDLTSAANYADRWVGASDPKTRLSAMQGFESARKNVIAHWREL